MKEIPRSLILLTLVACIAACASAPPHSNRARAVFAHSATDPRFQFEGTWEGILEGYNANHYVDGVGFPYSFRIVVGRWKVRVYELVSDGWQELKPGQYRMRNSGPQALIFSTTSDRENGTGGVWVESHLFTLTHISPDKLVVYFQRTVNNIDSPPTDQWYQFAWGHSGTMRRVKAGD